MKYAKNNPRIAKYKQIREENEPRQIKDADTITYEKGEVILLSKRFNEDSED